MFMLKPFICGYKTPQKNGCLNCLKIVYDMKKLIINKKNQCGLAKTNIKTSSLSEILKLTFSLAAGVLVQVCKLEKNGR